VQILVVVSGADAWEG